MTIRFVEEAQREFLDAISYYEKARAGFGRRFKEEVAISWRPENVRLPWLAAAVALPLQPLAFYFVRIPLDHWLAAQLGSTSTTYQWLISLYAPLTEEPAKLVPLLIPAIRRDIQPANFVRYALAIGEMWFIAERITHMPTFNGMPFYQFGGYVGERLMVCLFHSAFVSVALWRLRRGFPLGFAGARRCTGSAISRSC